MTLGPQCWGCRQRRVRCDSKQPGCSKCVEKGYTCPGYSTTKPLRWRHRIIRTGSSSLPQPDSLVAASDDVAPSYVILDALTYYNAVVAPDLAADASSAYSFDISKWSSFNKSKRHLTLCLVTMHRAVRKHGHVNEHQTLFHYHQACAAEILSHKIRTFGHAGPDPELFEDISLFFFSQVQASAYGAWRTHLSAAKTLLDLWGIETMVGNPGYTFHLYHLVLADIYGVTMAPSDQVSAEHVAQHEVYLQLLGRFNVAVWSTMVPVPEEIIRATITINLSRSAKVTQGMHTTAQDCEDGSASLRIIECLQAFDPIDWAANLPEHTSAHSKSWALLATCFQTATILYSIHTCTSNARSSESTSTSAYEELIKATRELYDLRERGGVHYKYILWPMVICGIESVAKQDESQLQFLCESLEQTTTDLGTLSMREAAVFLQQLRRNGTERSVESPDKVDLEWDTIFSSAPLFLL